MQFRFQFTKTGNFFHFVSNLTEWHFSCRKRDNQNWLAKTGVLTEKEKVALEKLKTILGEYSYGKSFLGIPFVRTPEESVWDKVKTWVDAGSYQNLREIFDIFAPRFEKIWQEEKPKLRQWQEQLEKATKKQEVENVIQDLEAFFGTSASEIKVDVFFIINSTKNVHGGGANIGKGAITIECSSTKHGLIYGILATLWHETIHLVFQEKHLIPLLQDFVQIHGFFLMDTVLGKTLRSPLVVLKEAIVSALIPGYLAEKYFKLNVHKTAKKRLGKDFENAKKNPKSLQLWTWFAADKLYPTVKSYIQEKKRVDKEFLEKTLRIYKGYLKMREQ